MCYLSLKQVSVAAVALQGKLYMITFPYKETTTSLLYHKNYFVFFFFWPEKLFRLLSPNAHKKL